MDPQRERLKSQIIEKISERRIQQNAAKAAAADLKTLQAQVDASEDKIKALIP